MLYIYISTGMVIVSGLIAVFSFLQFKLRDQRLPEACEFVDLRERLAGLKQEHEKLQESVDVARGLILDGEVVENPDNLFPEFGHSVVSDDDWPCKCGARGCVDTLVCGGGIARHGQVAVDKLQETLLRDLCGGDSSKLTTHMIFQAAERRDKVALSILDRVATLLGRLCSNIVLTVQPEKIVFERY